MNRRAAILRSLAVAASTGLAGLPAAWASAGRAAPPFDFDAVQLALVRALLAFDHPAFPRIAPQAVAARIDALFGTRKDERYRFGLETFDDLAAFATPPAAILAAESAAGADEFALHAAMLSEGRVYSERMPAGFLDIGHFRSLPLDAARTYVGLWVDSEFAARRRFFVTAKSLVMASAYSTDAMWAAIGYEGPFKDRPR
jgi:hypothetical protein